MPIPQPPGRDRTTPPAPDEARPAHSASMSSGRRRCHISSARLRHHVALARCTSRTDGATLVVHSGRGERSAAHDHRGCRSRDCEHAASHIAPRWDVPAATVVDAEPRSPRRRAFRGPVGRRRDVRSLDAHLRLRCRSHDGERPPGLRASRWPPRSAPVRPAPEVIRDDGRPIVCRPGPAPAAPSPCRVRPLTSLAISARESCKRRMRMNRPDGRERGLRRRER